MVKLIVEYDKGLLNYGWFKYFEEAIDFYETMRSINMLYGAKIESNKKIIAQISGDNYYWSCPL